jgi:hypothetical protein
MDTGATMSSVEANTSAGRRLAHTEVILRAVGSHVSDRSDLHRLCAVNWAFHDTFTPFLYAHLSLDTSYLCPPTDNDTDSLRLGLEVLERLAENPHLRFARELRCPGRDGNHIATSEFGPAVNRVLGKTPRLTKFVLVCRRSVLKRLHARECTTNKNH